MSNPTSEGRVLTCVYCGKEYPQDTPAWGSQVLTDHIKVCEKHPMRAVEKQNAELRQVLVMITSAARAYQNFVDENMWDPDGPNPPATTRARYKVEIGLLMAAVAAAETCSNKT